MDQIKFGHIDSKVSSGERNSLPFESWTHNFRELTFQETEEMYFCKTVVVSGHFETKKIVDKQFPVIFEFKKYTTTERNSRDSAQKSRPAPIKAGRDRIAKNAKSAEFGIENEKSDVSSAKIPTPALQARGTEIRRKKPAAPRESESDLLILGTVGRDPLRDCENPRW
jgi:hypothetical protein